MSVDYLDAKKWINARFKNVLDNVRQRDVRRGVLMTRAEEYEIAGQRVETELADMLQDCNLAMDNKESNDADDRVTTLNIDGNSYTVHFDDEGLLTQLDMEDLPTFKQRVQEELTDILSYGPKDNPPTCRAEDCDRSLSPSEIEAGTGICSACCDVILHCSNCGTVMPMGTDEHLCGICQGLKKDELRCKAHDCGRVLYASEREAGICSVCDPSKTEGGG